MGSSLSWRRGENGTYQSVSAAEGNVDEVGKASPQHFGPPGHGAKEEDEGDMDPRVAIGSAFKRGASCALLVGIALLAFVSGSGLGRALSNENLSWLFHRNSSNHEAKRNRSSCPRQECPILECPKLKVEPTTLPTILTTPIPTNLTTKLPTKLPSRTPTSIETVPESVQAPGTDAYDQDQGEGQDLKYIVDSDDYNAQLHAQGASNSTDESKKDTLSEGEEGRDGYFPKQQQKLVHVPFWQAADLSHLFPSNDTLMRDLPAVLKTYAEFHRKSLENPGPHTKYLIYTCTNNCGGLGNRLMGILTLLAVAIETDRVFGIAWDYPFPLENSMVPAMLNWHQARVAREKFVKKKPLVIKGTGVLTIKNAVKTIMHDSHHQAVVSRINVDVVDKVMVEGTKLRSVRWSGRNDRVHPLLRTWFLKMLFRPSHELDFLIKQRSSDLGLDFSQPYVGVHMRMGLQLKEGGVTSKGGSNNGVAYAKQTAFQDARPRHDMSDVPTFTTCAATMLQLFPESSGNEALQAAEGAPQIFLASDSGRAKERFKGVIEQRKDKSPNPTSTPLYFKDIAFHTDMSGKHLGENQAELAHAILGDRMTWVEFTLLAGSQCVVLSQSTFSLMVATFRRSPGNFRGSCLARFDHCSISDLKRRIESTTWDVRQGVKFIY